MTIGFDQGSNLTRGVHCAVAALWACARFTLMIRIIRYVELDENINHARNYTDQIQIIPNLNAFILHRDEFDGLDLGFFVNVSAFRSGVMY